MRTSNYDELVNCISKNRGVFSNIFPFELRSESTFHLDLSHSNEDFKNINICDNSVFDEYLNRKVLEEGQRIPVGGYNERRILYSGSEHFGTGDHIRDIHLGIDIWVEAGTPISAPLDSLVHSFANNTNYRDYGPTIILEHSLGINKFYSLYGHLSIASISDIFQGKKINAGEIFASIGESEVNGSWPPHLHFQLIRDLGNFRGDFPGVSSLQQRDYFLDLCPNPDLIFGLNLPY